MVDWSVAFIQAYGPLSVFFVVILEEVLVPIPSALVLMGAGFILIEPGLALWDAAVDVFFIIALPASVASTIGSFFVYGVGYFGGKPLIGKLQKFLGITWADVLKEEKRFTKGKKVWVTIAALRAFPFFPIALVSLTAGVLRLDWKKYAIATFLGSIPRTFILGMIGWKVGSSYAAFAKNISIIENVLALAVVVLVVYLLYRFRHKYMHHYDKIRSRVIKK
jgi:membrane protein DedA with SNARE-associated domain